MVENLSGRDRLREVLDAVLDEDNRTLGEMAEDAYASPYHFAHRLRRDAGEPPVAMRRRVELERAAWRLRRGTSVTEAAFAAGYESVEGFSRAFAKAYGEPPSAVRAGGPRDHWLPAPNGIHFHPPTSLWVDAGEAGGPAGDPVTEQLVRHDLDDTRALLDVAKGRAREERERVLLPGNRVLAWDGEEASLAAVLENHVHAKEVWLAAIEGLDSPARGDGDLPRLLERHDAVAPRWLAMVRDVDRRGAWGDRLVDALCEPPESFLLGEVVGHVLTYAAHRRQLARMLLRTLGAAVDHGDPIMWSRTRSDR
ncbi:helix-turn-helix domain-containing protein [Nocardioides deserti]|uniref:Helix-turn-helix domain-containing protein n=1 Tax=Nocardioides deserti TaxID=1588644 RepID=A0ABR6UA87_9ACTN|nr:helix-turn-helix domain-containing protein [Nocardioides deserti]MBC2961280.1 helix-turn-helix domain-containing protein [Nocardioides deserti]GGO72281.1 AraC family transcriptional regulator [Nocardioides deserti]